MFNKFTSSLNQLALSFKKAINSIFLNLDDQQTFNASVSPRRSFGRVNSPSYLSLSEEKPRQSQPPAQEAFLENNPLITPVKLTINKNKTGDNGSEVTFGVAESSQKYTETFSNQTASFKRYEDSSYEILTQQFARTSPQGSQVLVEKAQNRIGPIRMINFWKKIYQETSQLSSESFHLNLDILTPLPIKPEKPLVEFKYNKRTRSYEAVRQTSLLKRKYDEISIAESAMSLETDPDKESGDFILKKLKLGSSMERERKIPQTFHSRGRKKKVESFKSKMKI